MRKVFVAVGLIFVLVVFVSVHTQAARKVKVGVDCLSYLGTNADLRNCNLSYANLYNAILTGAKPDRC